MGYHTEFFGLFNLDKMLASEHAEYLRKFGNTRRMRRGADLAQRLPDPAREAVGLPIGPDGGYFVGGGGHAGQDHDDSITEYNYSPGGQPGLWCQWVPTDDQLGIEWNGGEKFYDYVEWIQYLIGHFLKPWGYRLSGEVRWEGEEQGDIGMIVIESNVVTTRKGRVVYEDAPPAAPGVDMRATAWERINKVE